MNQSNPAPDKVKEHQVVGSIKVIETEYRVKSPVFETVEVKVPKFIDEPVKRPVGIEQLLIELAGDLAKSLADQVETIVAARVDKALDARLKEVKSPKIIEEVRLVEKVVEVDRPQFRDVTIERPVYKDKEVVNPVVKDVEVVNAVIVDRTVVNADVRDVKVTNAIITDVPVERAVIREKVIEVNHKNCHCEHGKPIV